MRTVSDRTFSHCVATDSRLAAISGCGVILVSTDGTVRTFTIDPEWYAALWSSSPPDTALISPSGRTVGAAYRGQYTVLWDAETGEPLHRDEHQGASLLLDDTRLLKTDTFSSTLHDWKSKHYQQLQTPDQCTAMVADEIVVLGCPYGAQVHLKHADLTPLSTLDGLDKEYGTGTGLACIASSPTHTASYAALAGILRVSTPGGLVEQPGWSGAGTGLSVSSNGQRAVIFRDLGQGRAEAVDVEADSVVEIRGQEGLISPGVTPDGQHLILPEGTNLRKRTVHVAGFDGSEAAPVHTVNAFADGFIGFRESCYAVRSYTLRGTGEVVLQRAGIKRALAKVKHPGKEQPWEFAIGHGSEELVVSWESETILYDMKKRPKPIRTLNHRAMAAALGPPGYLAHLWFRDNQGLITIERPGQDPLSVEAPFDSWSAPKLALSPDGSLLFVGRPDGVLAVRSTLDGALLAEVPLLFGRFSTLLWVGEALWVLGEDDGQVLVVGVPG